MSEFNLIEKYFTWENPPESVDIAVGDDAAVLNIPPGKQLVTSVDTLISGVHFPENTSPFDVGYKALAVNLSDLAAMGAKPKWFTLALTIPEIDENWLNSFSKGVKSLAQKHKCFLIGGDTTRGPLSISIQVMGLVDDGKALLRSGAKTGDKIYVTGSLGDATVGLQTILGKIELSDLSYKDADFCQQRLNQPTPRLVESNLIKSYASSCIDVSDGLLQDLSHVLKASKVGAKLNISKLPFSKALKILDKETATKFALTGGDDYELLFTVPLDMESQILSKLEEVKNAKVTYIGEIINTQNTIIDELDNLLTSAGYNHFND